MKRLFLLFALVLTSAISYSQVCPTPSNSDVNVSLKAQYEVGSYAAAATDVAICYKNNSVNLITGVQFRVWYDSNAFNGANPTVTSLNTSFAQHLDYKVDAANHNITISIVYTGSSSSFSIPDGELIKLHLNHSTGFENYATNISNMTFSGVQTFTAYSSKQDGSDFALNLHNAGGVMHPQTLNYHGTFTNVTGSGSKNIIVALEKKPKVGSTTWTVQDTSLTDVNGDFAFSQAVDTTFYDVRLAVKGDTLTVGNTVTTADAQKINRFVLGIDTPSAFDFYTSDVNGSNSITVSDAYVAFGRLSGRFNAWVNNVPDVRFFTVSEYNTITGTPATNYTSSISGVTNLYFPIIAGQPDSVTFYVMGYGDANGTGFHMARITPIEIVIGSPNPSNVEQHIIDATTEYDNASQLKTIEVHVPSLSVDAGNLVNVPVDVRTTEPLGALQIAFKFDSDLLEFKSIATSEKVSKWISFTNPANNIVEWGGYDLNENSRLLNNDQAFTLQFIAKQPQYQWGKSPLYVTRKFAGDNTSKDVNITPTDGILQVFKVSGPNLDQIDFASMMAFPNPTDGEVHLVFEVKEDSKVVLGVFDMNGRKVIEVLQSSSMPAGKYQYTTDLGNLPQGLYHAVLQTTKGTEAKGIIKN